MCFLGMLFFLTIPAFGLKIVTKEIKFEDDPIEILLTWANLIEREYSTELYCWVEYINRSDK